MGRLFPEVVEEKSNVKEELLVDKCMNCSSLDVIPVSEFEHDFGDDIDKHNGVLCNDCGCIHFLDEGNLTYEYSYKDIIFDKKVNWSITDN